MQEFDKITKEISDLVLNGKGDNEQIKKLVEQQDEIIKSMSDEEIEQLLDRNIPGPYKSKIQRLRGM